MSNINKNTVVKTAVIAAAGMGTRFLPQTKAMPKEMLPVIDKPVIQYVVEALVASGVEQIIIVTGSTKRAIEDHFDRSVELEETLRSKGKHEAADQIKHIGEMANFIYVRQKGAPAGNARPILNVAELLGNEPFFYFFADDFFTSEIPAPQQLLDVYRTTGSSVVALQKVAKDKAHLYGIAGLKQEVEKDSVYELDQIIEKPDNDKAPSQLAVASGYLFTPDILPYIKSLTPSKRGEIEVTDAIAELLHSKPMYGKVIKGLYHDTGNPLAYLQTQIEVALKHPEYGGDIRSFIDSL